MAKKKNQWDYTGYVPATGSTMASFARFQKDLLELEGFKSIKPKRNKKKLPVKRKDNFQRG